MPESLVSSLIVLAMGFGLVLCVWGVFTVVPVVSRVVTRWFCCGLSDRNGSAEPQEDPWEDRRAVDVKRWAFEPSSALTCDKDRLQLPKLDPARDPEANEGNAERVAKEMLIEPRWVTADAERVAMEELLIELRR
jgi:hypothetical protein